MRKLIQFGLIMTLLWGCSKDKTTSEIVMDGTWQVSNYLIGGVAYPNVFKDCTFVFAEKNVLQVTKDKIVYQENWFANTSQDGSKKFEFSISTPELKGLDGTWNIMGISNGSLSLSLPGDSSNLVKKLDLSKI